MTGRKRKTIKGILIAVGILFLLFIIALSTKQAGLGQESRAKVSEKEIEYEEKETQGNNQIEKTESIPYIEEETEENKLKISSVTVQYDQTEEPGRVEILKENEDTLKVFLAEKNAGNGVTDSGEIPYSEIHAEIKNVVDEGGYLTFICEWEERSVSMIYYKDSGNFAFQPTDTVPGRTNNYQAAGEENNKQ